MLYVILGYTNKPDLTRLELTLSACDIVISNIINFIITITAIIHGSSPWEVTGSKLILNQVRVKVSDKEALMMSASCSSWLLRKHLQVQHNLHRQSKPRENATTLNVQTYVTFDSFLFNLVPSHKLICKQLLQWFDAGFQSCRVGLIWADLSNFTYVGLTAGLLCCGVGFICSSRTVRCAITHFAHWYTQRWSRASPLTRVTVSGITIWKGRIVNQGNAFFVLLFSRGRGE